MVLNNSDNKNVTISCSSFNLEESELKSNKVPRLIGLLSTSNVDSNKDLVTKEAQLSLIQQIKDKASKNRFITMDEDHESFQRRSDNPLKTTGVILNKIPYAKIEDAELVEDNGVYKTKIYVSLNEDHPLYSSFLNSIKKGFLHSFSIVYKVTKCLFKENVRIIEDLVLRNVGITGVPVNEDSEFQLSLKSYLRKMEENQINEINTSLNELKSQVNSFEKVEEELKSQIQAKDTQIEELKSQLISESSVDEKIKALNVEELKSKIDETEELKSRVEELENTLNELKSKGIHKTNGQPTQAPAQTRSVNMLGVFN